MPLHHLDGQPATLDEWINLQLKEAKEWDLPKAEHLSPEEAIMCWVGLFAREVRELCDKHGVPLEVFEQEFPSFENEVAQHIGKNKWYRSEQAHADVGLQTVIESVRMDVHEVDVEGRLFAEIRAVIPSVHANGLSTEVVKRFPKEMQQVAA